jgi:hypothetical protein
MSDSSWRSFADELHNPDLEGLSRLLEALDPWLSQVVIIGG